MSVDHVVMGEDTQLTNTLPVCNCSSINGTILNDGTGMGVSDDVHVQTAVRRLYNYPGCVSSSDRGEICRGTYEHSHKRNHRLLARVFL